MDKKEKIVRKLMLLCLLITVIVPIWGQNVKQIKFCDKKYEYGVGKDSLTLYFNVLDASGKRIQNIPADLLQSYLVVKVHRQYCQYRPWLQVLYTLPGKA